MKRKNKTLKYYGVKYYGGVTNQTINNGTSNIVSNSTPDKESIFEVVGNKLAEEAKPVFEYAKEKGLRLLGLQTIKNPNDVPAETTANIDNKMNEIGETKTDLVSNAKAIGADAVKIADAGTQAVIANINDVLKNPEVGKSVVETAKETAAIGEKLLENFNDNLSTPKMKEEAKQAMDNAADYAEIVVKAADKPLNDAIDELNKAGTKAASAALSGAVKVGSAAVGAIPFYGAFIDLGIIANNAGTALSEMSKAASEAASTVSKVTEEISENVEEGIDKLDEQKKAAAKIENRTNESIQQFQNPLNNSNPQSVLKGGKTRRKIKRNMKSKRVRFAI